MSEVGDTLRQLRLKAGLTQRELATAAIVHWSTIARIEGGTRQLKLDIARALDVALQTGGALTALVIEGQQMITTEDSVTARLAPERYSRSQHAIAFLAEAERDGRPIETEHVSTQVEATRELADRLGILEGDPVMQTRYLFRIGGVVTATSHSWEPLSITGGTVIEDPHAGPFANRGIVKRFDAIGYEPRTVEEVLEFRDATVEERKTLGLTAVDKVVEIHQTFFAGDRVIEVADIVNRNDRSHRVRYHYRMEIR
jgi:DNA-binding GntR family transcriptional regulator/DNA-binding XRE family transcriptional regulator